MVLAVKITFPPVQKEVGPPAEIDEVGTPGLELDVRYSQLL